jgi:phosphatidylglycerol:prolipoprotein diacylglycerol transferase
MAMALGLSIFLFARDAGKHIAPGLKLTYEQGFQKTFDLGVWVIVSSILGARLFYVLENRGQFSGPMGFFDAFKIWEGGLVFYGGLFGGLAAGFWWVRKEKWPLSYTFDLVAPYILLGHAIGRVGCFLNGCCYGIVDEHWGMVFPGGEDSLPHLPTQLWELAGDLALFFILLAARRWTLRYSWLTLALYGLTYGILRYVIEFWRRSWDKKYLILFNSASQAISGILVLVSAIVIIWILSSRRKVKRNLPD